MRKEKTYYIKKNYIYELLASIYTCSIQNEMDYRAQLDTSRYTGDYPEDEDSGEQKKFSIIIAALF
jgi:hypothetical protein